MFDKLPLKALKFIISEYKIATKVNTTKMVNGKRKNLTKKELAEELDKHLEIKEDGEIIFKPKITGSGKIDAKEINPDDKFYIYDNEGGNEETLDLTDYYKLDEVEIYNDDTQLVSILGNSCLLSWKYMQKPNGLGEFEDMIANIESNNKSAYEARVNIMFKPEVNDEYDEPINENNHLQVFIYRENQLVGFLRF